jgi:hypothetical protein
MKPIKSMWLLSVLTVGVSFPSIAQQTLPAATVVPVNYKYLTSVNGQTVAQPVNMVQLRAAAFNVKNSEFYEDDYDNYFISFYIPDGVVLAVYDKDGKLLRTVEKFKKVSVPPAVRAAVGQRFPQWAISDDVYLVNFDDANGAKKVYKLLLQNGDKRLRVKTDENGDFL